jgi:hypothetical protein
MTSMQMYAAQVELHNCSVIGGTTMNAGALGAWEDTVVAVHDTVFSLNKAADAAGGLYFSGNSRSRLSHVKVVNNSATKGGGVFVDASAQVSDSMTAVGCHRDDGCYMHAHCHTFSHLAVAFQHIDVW